ncbi:MAG: PEP-CTERM sorting domain-containing protein [Phormidium sp.]
MMKKLSMVTAGSVFIALGTISSAQGAIITFNDAISGAPSYSFDGDGDGINDVIFTTTDPNGFNTVGPGPNMTYVQQPGLEGTSLLPVDLRVDFLVGAENYLKFGFALNSGTESPQTFTSFQVYDRNNNLLASDLEYGRYTYPNGTMPSSFPEGVIETNFTGVAAYALFNFSSDFGRYLIDNFEGNFGTTEVSVPEPASTLGLLALGTLGAGSMLKRQQQKNATKTA